MRFHARYSERSNFIFVVTVCFKPSDENSKPLIGEIYTEITLLGESDTNAQGEVSLVWHYAHTEAYSSQQLHLDLTGSLALQACSEHRTAEK